MPNTNAFEAVVHKMKIFKDSSKFSPFGPLKWPFKEPAAWFK